MSQTSYSLKPGLAMPGQLYDTGPVDIVSYRATENIPFGSAVEIDDSDDTVSLPKDTTLGKIAGVARRVEGKTTTEGWLEGEMVAVVRKGRIYARLTASGTEGVSLDPVVAIAHASTDGSGLAAQRGSFNSDAADTDAGQENTVLTQGGVMFFKAVGVAGLCLLELNLPAGVAT